MKMVVARLAGAVMASSLNQNKFWTRCCCDGGIKPAPSPLGRWSCVSIPSLEWLSRLVHLILFTVAKEKSGGSESVAQRRGDVQQISGKDGFPAKKG